MYGIYDGHGGKFVSKFLSKNLPEYFIKKTHILKIWVLKQFQKPKK